MSPKIYLCVSIDCECDKGAGWACRRPLSFDGVAEGMAKRLHPLFLQYAAKPTYLVSAEVLRDERSVNWLQRISSQAELGTHLHGEFVEPDSFVPAVASAFQRDYSPEIETLKMMNLTKIFNEAFGRPPRSFRAGRFGIGTNSLEILHKLGYWVDCSVTPHVSWENVGGPSFRGAPTQPYRPQYGRREQSHTTSAANDILEAPVTIRPSRLAAVPIFGKYASARWLRPTWGSAASLLSIAQEEIESSRSSNQKAIMLNCMFHNVEVVPNLSPYASNEAAARSILKRLEELLKFAAERIHFCCRPL